MKSLMALLFVVALAGGAYALSGYGGGGLGFQCDGTKCTCDTTVGPGDPMTCVNMDKACAALGTPIQTCDWFPGGGGKCECVYGAVTAPSSRTLIPTTSYSSLTSEPISSPTLSTTSLSSTSLRLRR